MTLTRQARWAGFLYLLLALLAPLRLLYIPAKLFVEGDAAATARNIQAHEGLFRSGILADLLCGILLVFITLAFHRLFKDVDARLAVLVVILGGVLPAAIDFINVLNDAAVLLLLRGGEYLAAFDKPQREALAMLFLRLHGQEILAAQLLWGLWLFPLGALVYRSRFLPRFLGIWLFINGLAYLAMGVTGLAWPHHEPKVSSLLFPALLGEIALVLWLLVRGARPDPAEA